MSHEIIALEKICFYYKASTLIGALFHLCLKLFKLNYELIKYESQYNCSLINSVSSFFLAPRCFAFIYIMNQLKWKDDLLRSF